MRKRPPLFALAAALALTGCIDATNPTTAPSHQYSVLFRDDFTLTCPTGTWPACDSARWAAYPDGWHDTTGNGVYDCSKVCSEHNGKLDLYIHTVNGVHYVAAPLPILRPGSDLYGAGLNAGRYTIRFKMNRLPGYKVAWMLWPDSGIEPQDGNIDFPEVDLDGVETMRAFLHHEGATSDTDQDAYRTNVIPTDGVWHTTTIEWRPDASFTSFYLDGKLVGTSTSRIPNTALHWILQSETCLACVTPDATAGHILIDYVEVDGVPAS
ncbi:MAG TPA: glycoside hydrolase family 16 protein [Gemmatimonadaceae bacterium]